MKGRPLTVPWARRDRGYRAPGAREPPTVGATTPSPSPTLSGPGNPHRSGEEKLSMADARLGSCCRDLGDGVQREGRKVKQDCLKMLLL